jgi:two-component system chemotaxis response regulator CheB
MMRPNRLVVMGTSAGGLDALRIIAAALPSDFPAAIAVVMHLAPESPGVLDGILDRAGPLPAVSPDRAERLAAGRIYVARPDHHLIVEPDKVRPLRGPRENRCRPAIDPLFRSAAQVYGPAAIGVILTGHLDDGTAGLWTIKQLGGVAIVQDPAEAPFPGMPLHAIGHVNVDHVVPLAGIAPLLVRLTAAPLPDVPVPQARET